MGIQLLLLLLFMLLLLQMPVSFSSISVVAVSRTSLRLFTVLVTPEKDFLKVMTGEIQLVSFRINLLRPLSLSRLSEFPR